MSNVGTATAKAASAARKLAERLHAMSDEQFKRYIDYKLLDVGLAHEVCCKIMSAGQNDNLRRLGNKFACKHKEP
jgi:hypothetical protein